MADLLALARAGDGDAFARLFQEHAPLLWKTAVAVMRDEDSAADALQETAVKAWRAVPRFDGKSALSTWLTRILLNTCYDELRVRKKVIPFEDIAREADAGAAPVTLHGAAPEGPAEACARMDVHRALEQLAPDDRLVLSLFYVSDLPVARIAEALGVSEGAVRTRLSRARQRFKETYLRADGPRRTTPHESHKEAKA